MITTAEVYLKFKDKFEDKIKYVSINDLTYSGYPIDENGDDYVQLEDILYIEKDNGEFHGLIPQ